MCDEREPMLAASNQNLETMRDAGIARRAALAAGATP
jgi:hypothetical protein